MNLPEDHLIVERKLKPIIVYWKDHCSTSSWFYPEDADRWSKKDPLLCVTVGFLWAEDRQTIVVSSTISDTQCADLLKILKTDVIKRRFLKI